MATSDIIAVVVMISCTILGILGTFKWLVRFLTGALLGFLILACVAVLAEKPKFDEYSSGVFRDGIVIPYVRRQISILGSLVSSEHQETSNWDRS
jgi:hypothetical protein